MISASAHGHLVLYCHPSLQRAYAAGNFARFFGLVRTAPYLLACLSHIYFGQVGTGRAAFAT
jgi:hypothetical protein